MNTNDTSDDKRFCNENHDAYEEDLRFFFFFSAYISDETIDIFSKTYSADNKTYYGK